MTQHLLRPAQRLTQQLHHITRTVSHLPRHCPSNPTIYRPIQLSLAQIRHLSSSTTASTPEKPAGLTAGESAVWDVLVAELAPTNLVVRDISGGCGSMYEVDVASDKFRGMLPLRQNRMVNAALGDMIKEWHGIRVHTRVP